MFLIGIVVSVIVGLLMGGNWYTDTNNYVAITLAVLGFIVGVLSFFAVGTITRDKIPTFLIAALLLVGIGATSTWFNNLQVIGPFLSNIAGMIAVFIAPAAGLLAIKAIWDVGKGEEINKLISKK